MRDYNLDYSIHIVDNTRESENLPFYAFHSYLR